MISPNIVSPTSKGAVFAKTSEVSKLDPTSNVYDPVQRNAFNIKGHRTSQHSFKNKTNSTHSLKEQIADPSHQRQVITVKSAININEGQSKQQILGLHASNRQLSQHPARSEGKAAFASNHSQNITHPAHTVIAHREYELNSKNSTQNNASLRVYAESQFLQTNLYKQYLKIQDKYAKSLNRLRTMQRLGKAKRNCTSNQKHYTQDLVVKPKKKGPYTPHAQDRWACLPLSQKYLYEFMIGEQKRQQQIDESLLANTDLHQLGMSFNTSQTISVHKQHTNDADDFINLTNDGAQGMKHIYLDDSQKKKS